MYGMFFYMHHKKLIIHEGNYMVTIPYIECLGMELSQKSRARGRCCTHLVFFGGGWKGFQQVKPNQCDTKRQLVAAGFTPRGGFGVKMVTCDFCDSISDRWDFDGMTPHKKYDVRLFIYTPGN